MIFVAGIERNVPIMLFSFLLLAFCALARPWQGIIIGAVGALITCLGGPLCEKLKIDDPVGVVPVHGMASIWSLLAVGIFGEYDELNANFIRYDGKRQNNSKSINAETIFKLCDQITHWILPSNL